MRTDGYDSVVPSFFLFVMIRFLMLFILFIVASFSNLFNFVVVLFPTLEAILSVMYSSSLWMVGMLSVLKERRNT